MKKNGRVNKGLRLLLTAAVLFYVTLSVYSDTPDRQSCFIIRFGKAAEKSEVVKNKAIWEAKGCPVSIREVSGNGEKTYELEIGGFKTEVNASLFAGYFGIDTAHVVEAEQTGGDTRTVYRNKIVRKLSETDAGTVYYYFGRNHPFLLLYRVKSGFEGALIPSDLILFAGGSETEFYLEDVTGFEEKEDVLLVGKSVEVFFEYGYVDIGDKTDEIKKTASTYGIQEDVIKKHLLYFDDGASARVTLLAVCDVERLSVSLQGNIGFDFYSEQEGQLMYTGDIARYKRKPVSIGNGGLAPVELGAPGEIGHYASGGITLYAKKDPVTRLGSYMILFKE
ncbi:MAG: hypothetical protein JW881_11785 [Spirochaetales bacterium]|nr:hypothetical protein [Spirochaetales bacterium]